MGFVYALLSIIGIFFVIYLFLGVKFLKVTVIPKIHDNWNFMLEQIARKDYKWYYLDMPHEKIEIRSKFRYKLFARIFKTEQESHKWIIISHGWTSKGLGQYKYVDLYRELGYNVLVVDHRYSGESGGRCISFSYFEKHDLISWIDEIQKRDPKAEFGIYGESMGAATAIYVASMDKRIEFLISYCAYTSVIRLYKEVLLEKLSDKSEVIKKFVLTAFVPFKVLTYLLYGVKIASIDTCKAIREVKIPTLIMHSKADKLININNAYDLLAVKPDAEYIEFEESAHALSYTKYPEKFKEGIQTFIKNIKK